jgi:hypothetical protein
VCRLVGNYALMPPRRLPALAALAVFMLGLLNWTEAADAGLSTNRSFPGSTAFGSINFDDVISFGRPLLPSVAQSTYPGGSLGDLFNRGDLIGEFAAGFLGAGVVGFLFGHGVVGELSGVASVLGLLFQLALIAMLARLIWTWWHDKKNNALSPRQLADAYLRPRHEGLPPIEPAKPGSADDADHDEPQSKVAAKTEQPHC